MQRLAESWISVAKKERRDVFSELDVLLRALDRFFNVENLPIPKEDLPNTNFYDELSAVRDTIHVVVGLLDAIIPESKKNVYWFQKFAEAKYLTDRSRDALREELYKQDMPEKGLLLLYDSFVNLKVVITDILRAEQISFLTYRNMGQIIGRELRENVFFNPFRKDPDPEFDVIENREVSKIVKTIRERETKKYVSAILLHLFRFLRYLRYADTSSRFGSLSSSLLIILLLRSEFVSFVGYLEKMVQGVSDSGLRAFIKSLSYQFSMESKRVFLQELGEVFGKRSPRYLKGKMENCHGILKNLSEQCVVQLVQFLNPGIKGNDIFGTFITRREQAVRLREDILILRRFLALVGEAASDEERLRIFASMRNFMLYFRNFTFRLLRHDDYEEFSFFLDKILAVKEEELEGKGLDAFLDTIRRFKVFMELCLGLIANRADLAGVPPDTERVEESVKRYLQG